jgi:hypothetical protein
MGELFFFDLGQLYRAFQPEAFFETGTGFGFGVQHARIFPFRQIFSVEIVPAEVERLRPAFMADQRVQLIAGKSVDAMQAVLPTIAGNMLFWLDAHFPGAQYKVQRYDAEREEDIRLPLERELALIKQLRPGKRDVILIDDLRIYEDDKFEWGNLNDYQLGHVGKRDSRFLYEMFKDTHDHHRFLNHSGYFALTPKPLPTQSAPGEPNAL